MGTSDVRIGRSSVATANFDERVLVVPAQQLPVRDAEPVDDGRRVMDPHDEGERGFEDERDADVEATQAVEPQVPRRDPLAVDALERGETELVEPALDVRRAAGARRPAGSRVGMAAV